MKNPEVDPNDPGPFFYNQFPSLLKEPIVEVGLKREAETKEEEENWLLGAIEEEY
jgi:hypothetical protein